MRLGLFVFIGLFAAGCGSLHKQDTAVNSLPEALLETPLLLERHEVHQERLKQFVETSRSFTETDKINYLLAAIRSSGITFVRNGDHYNGDVASRWLRWKMMHPQYRDKPIVTARDFVDRVCLRSERSGRPYEVILSDGVRDRLRKVLNYELLALDHALREASLMNALSGDGSSFQTQQGSVPTALLIPPPATS